MVLDLGGSVAVRDASVEGRATNLGGRAFQEDLQGALQGVSQGASRGATLVKGAVVRQDGDVALQEAVGVQGEGGVRATSAVGRLSQDRGCHRVIKGKGGRHAALHQGVVERLDPCDAKRVLTSVPANAYREDSGVEVVVSAKVDSNTDQGGDGSSEEVQEVLTAGLHGRVEGAVDASQVAVKEGEARAIAASVQVTGPEDAVFRDASLRAGAKVKDKDVALRGARGGVVRQGAIQGACLQGVVGALRHVAPRHVR